ncbi:Homeobox-leucine zipper protein athb-21 [Thalictrum thalictroides]|uniref:Homeobox-leucine zipper protein n=1 Tax=Thalictrum thalictroides TaxID=46969 RepID=A0A7J6WHP1_THATH|nr:Homeobox-leucine zipper protein athb-21 [Thalictrum thalictroides]
MAMNQENVHFFFTTQDHGSLYTYEAASAEGETKKKKRQRRKKDKREGSVDVRKRKLSAEQVNALEAYFSIDHNLDTQRKERIALELGLDPQQVAVWFQNRRVRWRIKKLEDEYYQLKATHESVIVEKSQLETQVLRLKAELSDAQNEMARLEERLDGVSSSTSQSSPFSMDMDPFFLGDFGNEGLEKVFYFNNPVNGMEWMNDVYDK